MADVFISYQNARRSHAERLAVILEARGFSVWWDNNLFVGTTFRDQIELELNASSIVVVLWCSSSVKSTFVRSEASRAEADGKLLSAFLEQVRAPLGFDERQALSLLDWSGSPDHPAIVKLVNAIGSSIGRTPADASNVVRMLSAHLPPLPSLVSEKFEPEPSSATPRDGFAGQILTSHSSTSNTTDERYFEACRTADDFEAYLGAFPSGKFTALARTKMSSLDRSWIESLGLTHKDWSQKNSREILGALGSLASRSDLEPRARRGCVEAMTLLGIRLHEAGDIVGAIELLTRAAGNGFARAQNNLAVYLEEAGKTDRARILTLLGDASNQGNAMAQLNLSIRLMNSEKPEDLESAIKWLRRAYDQGHREAANMLGWAHILGVGVPQNSQLAVPYFRELANAAAPYGHSSLGYCLMYGQGIEQDVEEGLRLLRLAAEQGIPFAQLHLALALKNGWGTTSDEASAIAWLKSAAGAGLEEAKQELEKLETSTSQ